MRRRHTRSTDPNLAGGSVQRAVRLPEVQLKEVQGAIGAGLPDIHNVTDAIVDALWLWLYENKRAGGWKDAYGPVTINGGGGEAVRFEPPTMDDAVLDGPPEPAEADRTFTGADRPKWSDVDLAVLDGDG